MSWTQLAIAVLTLSGAAPPLRQDIDFELVNKAGVSFSHVWVIESGAKSWGQNLIKEPLKDGGSVQIRLANPDSWQAWDLRVQYSKRDCEQWRSLEVPQFKRLTILILPDGRWDAHYEKRNR
jgi:hypothetical protein